MDSILQEWEAFARSMEPAAAVMTDKDLRNHAALMLKSIANDLRQSQSRAESLAKSHGTESASTQINFGEEHGIARLDSKFTVEQLVSEYRALRSSVLRLWMDADSPKAGDIEDIIRFNEAIDQLLAASIFSFAKSTREIIDAEKQRKDQFLAMLAHELRNPLSPISAAATLLKMSKSDDTVVTNASNIIARQVSHMATLVDDLLDVSRVTRGAIDLKLECLDLRNLVNDAVEQVSPQIRARQHMLDVAEISEPIVIEGDKKRLVQVFANLLSNAAKYTPEQGNIRLEIHLYEGHVAITVEDNGIGMAPDFVPHVFDLFVQAERTSDRSSGGLGLGLALVKHLTELHGGKATCTSKGLGQGSTFSVWLPRPTSNEIPVERRRTPRVSLQQAKILKIMVVDDNVDAASTLAMLLELAGHEVAVASHASEAMERSKADTPDVFLLDIGLPDIDGNILARTLRAQSETANAVLIALTGYGMKDDRDRTTAAGFDHHLVKPVDVETLYRILAHVHPFKR